MKFSAKLIYLGLVFVLILLMTYKKIGELAHEILGFGLVMFAMMHAYKRAYGLKFSRKNLATKALNFALLFGFVATFISGVFVSEHVFAFLDFGFGADSAKNIHMFVAHALFLITALHLGRNFKFFKFKIKLSNSVKIPLFLAILAFGIYSFYDLHFYEYLFFKTGFGLENKNSLALSVVEFASIFAAIFLIQKVFLKKAI